MAKTQSIATAEQVREWARSNGYEVADRGRFNSDLIRAFNTDRDNKRKNLIYEPQARTSTQSNSASNTVPTARRSQNRDRAQVNIIPADEVADSIPTGVLEMLRAAQSGGGGSGNKALVSIHALVNV